MKKQKNIIFGVAGVITLTTTILAYTTTKNWLWITMLVGINMFQYAFTDWCLLEKILTKTKKQK